MSLPNSRQRLADPSTGYVQAEFVSHVPRFPSDPRILSVWSITTSTAEREGAVEMTIDNGQLQLLCSLQTRG
jgi:hypothetical protein